MNKFKKFLIGLIVAAGAACLCGAAACNKGNGSQAEEPEYYQLDLTGSGVDIVFEGELAQTDAEGNNFKFGGQVKEGVEVRFKVVKGDKYSGTPVIELNGERLTPDADSVYSFVMQENSAIAVKGLEALYTVKLPVIKEYTDPEGNTVIEERRIKFLDEKGEKELDEEVTLKGGEELKFKLWVSPYYADSYTVSCGFEELKPDDNGVYTLDVESDGEIDIEGLELQTSFANYENEPETYGDGTAANPYKISKPIDLYYLAVIINDEEGSYGGRFSGLYYELTADIDMKGEQLFVIGNDATALSAFSGSFNGNGHTISNFRITNEAVNQETYEKAYLNYVGLFGYVVATINNKNEIIPPVIKNVNLKDYTVEAYSAVKTDSEEVNKGTMVGSLVGYAIGAEISGCNAVGGEITVINDGNQIVNMGGLVGRLQGAYGTTLSGSVAHGTFVRSSSADVYMEGTGSPRSAGGIVGHLISAAENAVAYIVNSYSKGAVNGGMHSGGIVGTLGGYSSVTNCYSSAQVGANNELAGVTVSDDYKGAYAGGIAGYAEENTVIAGCYAANYTSEAVNDLSAYSINGARFMSTGAYSGAHYQPDAKAADSAAVIEYNNATMVSGHPASVFTGLGWVEDEWSFAQSGELPAVKIPATDRTITVKLQQVGGSASQNSYQLGAIAPMSDWYKQTELNEYDVNSDGRSWGYFFNEELTDKVPFGFVPTKAETVIYAGYADYNEVAGTYYVEKTEYSNGAYITLDADGNAEIRSGGLYYKCNYSYSGAANGAKITIYRSCLAALSYGEDEINGSYFAYGGTAQDGKLSLSAYLTLVDATTSAETPMYVSETNELTAVKAAENFAYGEYKTASGKTYLFRKNGTGEMTDGNTKTEFTFVPADASFNIVFAASGATTGSQAAVTVVNGKADTIDSVAVSLLNEFKGSWKKNANSATVFTFDGLGYVSLNGGGAVQCVDAGNGAVGFEIGNVQYKASVADGNLVINGENYYLSDGFTGEWFMLGAKEQIQVIFGGVGTNGYGEATVSYSVGVSETYEAQYDVDGNNLRIYVGDRQFGDLAYDADSNSVGGMFYSLLYDEYRYVSFYIYDQFRGVWTGVSEDFDTVTFNGRSASVTDSGVSIRTAGNVTKRGTYVLTDAAHGTMTVDGVTYAISFDESTGLVAYSLAPEGGTPVEGQLGRRDGWYGVELFDGDIKYSFDGKSSVGGKVTVSDGSSLEYTLVNGEVTLGENALTPNATGFGWNGKTLAFKSGFTGDWLVSGTDGLLTIGEVSGYKIAEVSFTGGSNYQFAYDPAARTLTLTEGETKTIIKLKNDYEMSITRTSPEGNGNYNCVKSGRADEWKGVYTAEDGSSWKFDGLGRCVYGSGTAYFTPASGEAVKYTYKINEIGVPFITAENKVAFVEVGAGEKGYSKDGGATAYKTVAVDAYYGRAVFTDVSSVRTSYFFDGVGTLWAKGDSGYTKAYSYEPVTNLRTELIGADGVRYNGEMSEVGINIKLTVTEQVKATANGVTYSFGVNTLWTVNADGSYTKAYKYTVISEKNGEYELTDGDGKKFTAKLTKGDDGNTLTIAPKAETSKQA